MAKLNDLAGLWRTPQLSAARRILLPLLLALTTLCSSLAVSTPAEGPAPSPVELVPWQQAIGGQGETVEIAEDSALPDGHFYRQGASSTSRLFGYAVTGAMWEAFSATGGEASLGLPISRQWSGQDGSLYQSFERALLQATVVDGKLVRFQLVNVMDALSAAGMDDWLEKTYRVPPLLAMAVKQQARDQTERDSMALLSKDPAIRQAFLATRDWRDRYGFPTAIRRYDQVVTLRTQRAIIHRWLDDSLEAAKGAIVAIDGARVAKTAGLVPQEAQRPMISPRYGWLRVAGRQIVDGYGRPIRLSGVNWSGFELRDFAPKGLAVRDYTEVVDRVAELGFNTIRLPFSNEMVEQNPVPKEILIAACPSCRGKTALEIMDMVIDYAGQKGLRIILDNHFSAAADQQGATLWYTKQYSEAAWLNDWQMLAERYKDNPTVIGFDLRNEPHGPATWGSGDPATDWRLAAEKAGRAILAINPHALILVEGIEHFPKPGGGRDSTWWGGNLMGAKQFPVRLPEANLLYSPHDYGPSLWRQGWFNSGTSPESLRSVWLQYWAYLNLELDLPLLVGELGTGNAPSDVEDQTPGSQGQWFQALLGLVRQRDNIHWLYWTINADDDFALFDGSYTTISSPTKLAALNPLMGQQFQALPGLMSRGSETADQTGRWKIAAR